MITISDKLPVEQTAIDEGKQSLSSKSVSIVKKAIRSAFCILTNTGFIAALLICLGIVIIFGSWTESSRTTAPRNGDCAASSLYEACKFASIPQNFNTLQEALYDERGSSVKQILKESVKLGFRAEAKNISDAELAQFLGGINSLAILHLDIGHFVLVVGRDGTDHLFLFDGFNLRDIPPSELKGMGWVGNSILLNYDRQPGLHCDTRIIDLGDIPAGQEKTVPLLLVNSSQYKLRISAVQADCGCLTTNLADRAFEPGEKFIGEALIRAPMSPELLRKNLKLTYTRNSGVEHDSGILNFEFLGQIRP